MRISCWDIKAPGDAVTQHKGYCTLAGVAVRTQSVAGGAGAHVASHCVGAAMGAAAAGAAALIIVLAERSSRVQGEARGASLAGSPWGDGGRGKHAQLRLAVTAGVKKKS